ncbi:hypothetical protein Moror_15131 [Moniliophthora roreri MCA 2997]|uniref:Uncharacterized protein n=1 Tax=Moniliophthora roreri (strain MCA 2997) TaxID=1381753 RepID=V2WYZ9_MONRO|nr:hypothetical protein Moror_15131 [Moniliophthora roreri MCA 2997]
MDLAGDLPTDAQDPLKEIFITEKTSRCGPCWARCDAQKAQGMFGTYFRMTRRWFNIRSNWMLEAHFESQRGHVYDWNLLEKLWGN